MTEEQWHFYFAEVCPWAHSVRIALQMTGTYDTVTMDFVDPDTNWTFVGGEDNLFGVASLEAAYQKLGKTKVVSVPVAISKTSLKILSQSTTSIVAHILSKGGHGLESNALDQRMMLSASLLISGLFKCAILSDPQSFEEGRPSLAAALGQIEKELEDVHAQSSKHCDIFLFPALLRYAICFEIHHQRDLPDLRKFAKCWDFTKTRLSFWKKTFDVALIRSSYSKKSKGGEIKCILG